MSNLPEERTSGSPPEEREQRKYQVLSQPDSLRGSLILLAAGAVLFLIVLCLKLGPTEGLKAIPSGSGVLGVILLVTLPAGLLTLIVIAQLAGTNYGTLKEMTVKLTALNAFLLGLGWLLLMSVEWLPAGSDMFGMMLGGAMVFIGIFLVWTLVAAGLFGNYFDLEFPEALGTFLLVSIVETSALFAFSWVASPDDWW
jgi:hypothetical protein